MMSGSDSSEITDVLTPSQRRFNMSRIRAKDTKPEMIVRSLVHRTGYRFRLHRSDLPGKPDLVFPGRGKIIFVHGCYWHMHACRYGRVVPKTNAEFWRRKRQGNKDRDRKTCRKLRRMGWEVLVVWECQTKPHKIEKLAERIVAFLES